MTLIRQAAAIAGKDLRLEMRARHGLTVVLPFAATLLVAFGLALGPGRARLAALAPALLWLATLFASVLAFGRSYEAETDDGAVEGLVLAPIDSGAIFLGKTAAVALQLLALQVAVLLLVGFLFGPSLGWTPALPVVLVLGTTGLAAVGGLFGVTAAVPRVREAVLPLLVLPLSVPVLLAGVEATRAAATGASVGGWLGLLLAFDAAFVALGLLVFEHLLEE